MPMPRWHFVLGLTHANVVWLWAMQLVDYRTKHNLTQAEFGERAGLSQAAVARYEAGKRQPQRDEMARIYAATNGEVTANDFAGHLPVPGEAA